MSVEPSAAVKIKERTGAEWPPLLTTGIGWVMSPRLAWASARPPHGGDQQERSASNPALSVHRADSTPPSSEVAEAGLGGVDASPRRCGLHHWIPLRDFDSRFVIRAPRWHLIPDRTGFYCPTDTTADTPASIRTDTSGHELALTTSAKESSSTIRIDRSSGYNPNLPTWRKVRVFE